ncbi:MAG: methyltransferase [Hyphomicrobiales bacterium]|nr:class I SAM-dependent methyltransferase [Hyphomicrobiales bacterium]PCH51618.1 MAG: methyltransferase [Hyphomicrobiales bacterium]
MTEHKMTKLAEKLKRGISVSGPISLAEYMHICMADPQYGYYKNQIAIGAKGDFITAPEVSQMFGELIGIWCIDIWQKLGAPNQFCLAELGPGKGTLMSDLLRAANIVPEFLSAANIVMVETSDLMRQAQKERLQDIDKNITWVSEVNDLPQMPTIVVANEFLDVLPVHQYVKSGDKWSERGVSVDDKDQLHDVLLAGTIEEALLPKGAADEPQGSVYETSPAREAIIEMLSATFLEHQGAALFIDYGHAISSFGDTFQALRSHGIADPLAEPGLADLTSHVDFERLAKCASRLNIEPRISTQAEFLLAMGLIERAGSLGQMGDAQSQTQISNAVERLASDSQMGSLFKVLSLTSNGILPSGL